MNWQELIAHYGYLAIVVGAFFEGETILVLGGILAHQGYLGLWEVMGSAFIGTLFGDQLYYYIGRYKGMQFIESRSRWKSKSQKIFSLLNRHQTLLIVGFRFLYGIRTVTPFVLGAAGIRPNRYIPLNVLGALVWAIGIGFLGYSFGHAVQLFLAQVHHYGKWFVSIFAMVLVIVGVIIYRRTQRQR
ncbi:DedA family protein [Celerinatantimonas yamalensis]|uniref:DedA family protein n=1 Tax=Celerinatantimonas yamalensis TaxID=559956 RepID=A0ABW9GAY8_9GAMM